MNSRIQTQTDKLQQLVFNPTTAETYKHAIALTWTIIKETGVLLWLVLCLVLVISDWFWNASYRTGQKARVWVENLQKPAPEASESEAEAFSLEKFTSADFWSATGKSLLESGKSAATVALNNAKGQLGMEVPDPKPDPKPAPIAPKPAPVVSVEPTPIAPAQPPSDDPPAVEPTQE